MNRVTFNFKSKVVRNPSDEDIKNIISVTHLYFADVIDSIKFTYIVNYTLEHYPNLLRDVDMKDLVPFIEHHDYKIASVRVRYATAICYLAYKNNIKDILDIYCYILKMNCGDVYNYMKRHDKFSHDELKDALSYPDFVNKDTPYELVHLKVLLFIFTGIMMQKEVYLNESMYVTQTYDSRKYRLRTMTPSCRKAYKKIEEVSVKKLAEYINYWLNWSKTHNDDISELISRARLSRSIISFGTKEDGPVDCELPVIYPTSQCVMALGYATVIFRALHPRMKLTFKNVLPYAVPCLMHHADTVETLDDWYCLHNCSGFKDEIMEIVDGLNVYSGFNALDNYIKNKERTGEVQLYKDRITELEKKVTELSNTDLKEEIKELKASLTQANNTASYYKKELEQTINVNSKYDELLEKYEEEHEELIKLREKAYLFEEEVVEEEKLTVEEMAECIEEFNLLIVGGHVNTQTKLKSRFPKWSYVSLESYASYDKNMGDNKDCIIILTGYNKHAVTEKFYSEHTPVDYVNTVNYNSIVKRIYEIMEKLT